MTSYCISELQMRLVHYKARPKGPFNKWNNSEKQICCKAGLGSSDH